MGDEGPCKECLVCVMVLALSTRATRRGQGVAFATTIRGSRSTRRVPLGMSGGVATDTRRLRVSCTGAGGMGGNGGGETGAQGGDVEVEGMRD